MNQLTTKEYWDNTYRKRNISPVDISGFRNFVNRQIFSIFKDVDFSNHNVLEIGGAGSSWIIFFASLFPDTRFTAIDYSREGCDLLSDTVNEIGLKNVDVVCMDFFDSADTFVEHFDMVYSFGVMEHFDDLGKPLAVAEKILKDNGKIITFIPNMSGILGILTKFLNKKVYDIHVPYNKNQLASGHERASLTVLKAGYLGSSKFGVLSSCVTREDGWKWAIYHRLSQLSKMIWFFESKVAALPSTSFFSPYIYVVAQKNR